MGLTDAAQQAPVWTFYDTDCGTKMSVAKQIQTSPIRYSIVRSTAPRFPSTNTSSTPFGVYTLDAGTKKTLQSVARDNRRFYAASFQSQTVRFPEPKAPLATDAIYDVSKVMNSQPATTEEALGSSPVHYAILRSKYKRFNDKPYGEGPDVLYNVDSGTKMSLQKSISSSPIKYGNMLKGIGRVKIFEDPTPPELGPGTYTIKHPSEVQSSAYEDKHPLSSLASRTSRFGRSRANSMGPSLGSTWTQAKDDKAWAARGRTISKSEVLRPMYMPKAFKGNDKGK